MVTGALGIVAVADLYAPGDYLVDGFQNLMPSTLAGFLSGEDIDAVVAYLLAQQ